MIEMKDTLDYTYDQAQKLKLDLEHLLDSDGWKFVEYFLEIRSSGLQKDLLHNPPATQEDCVMYAQKHGRVQEDRLIPEMIKQTLSDINEHLLKLKDVDQAEDIDNG